MIGSFLKIGQAVYNIYVSFKGLRCLNVRYHRNHNNVLDKTTAPFSIKRFGDFCKLLKMGIMFSNPQFFPLPNLSINPFSLLKLLWIAAIVHLGMSDTCLKEVSRNVKVEKGEEL